VTAFLASDGFLKWWLNPIQRLGTYEKGELTIGLVSTSSWNRVCVFRFCLSSDGNASSRKRVTTSIPSYATEYVRLLPYQNTKYPQETGSGRPHWSHLTYWLSGSGRSNSVPQSGQKSMVPVKTVCQYIEQNLWVQLTYPSSWCRRHSSWLSRQLSHTKQGNSCDHSTYTCHATE
jgi:hypothetical protein